MTHPLPRLSDIMARDLFTLSATDDVIHAMDQLIARRLSGAPVLDAAGKLVGVLSKKDCIQAAINASYHQEWGGSVADYMASPVQTLSPDLDLLEAAEVFLGSPFRRFPVVEGDRLVGQVSRIDLLRALSRQWR